MKKQIDLNAEIAMGDSYPDDDSFRQALEKAFVKANPRWRLAVTEIQATEEAGTRAVTVRIDGFQRPSTPFEPLARSALARAITVLLGLAQNKEETTTYLRSRKVQS